MKKELRLLMLSLLMTVVCGSVSEAQNANHSQLKARKVMSPVDNILRKAQSQQQERRAGMLRPVKSYTPMLSNLANHKSVLRPFNKTGNDRKVVMRTAGGKEIWGILINRQAWEGLDYWDTDMGAYSFSTSSSGLTPLYTDYYYMNINGGGTFYNDTFHGVNYYEYDGTIYNITYFEFDTDNWEQTEQSGNYEYSDFTSIAYASAYDPTSGLVYAFNRSASGDAVDFSTIDYSSLHATKISSATRTYVALAIDSNGNAYAIGLDGNLYTIDKANGLTTLVGSTGVSPAEALQSATFDLKDNTLYWAAINSNKSASLYTVDLTSGLASKVLDFSDGEEFVAIYVPMTADAGAPKPAENVETQFSEGSYTGTISFDIPTIAEGGAALQGEVNYSITSDDGEVSVNGTSKASQHVEETITFASEGNHKLTVVLTNSIGNSKAVNVQTGWIGLDKPYDTGYVELTIDDQTGNATLSWEAVTEGWNEGFIDTENVTYTVTDGFSGEVLIEKTKQTTYTFSITKGDYQPYYYVVRTYNGTIESEWGCSSNVVKWGYPLTVPFNRQLQTINDFYYYDIIDANNDRNRFNFDGRGLSISTGWRDRNDQDDWAILPPLAMEAGRSYYLTFTAECEEESAPRTISTAYGTDLNVDSYTILTDSKVIKAANGGEQVKSLMKVTTNGTYRLGIHDHSPYMQDGMLRISNIKVDFGPMLSAPDSVSNITLTADAMGASKVDISFTTPNKDLLDNAITSLTKVEVYIDDTELAKVFDNPAVGETLSFTHTGMAHGPHTYTFVAYNQSGKGLENQASTIVGYDEPAAPTNTVIEDYLNGSALFTWQAPAIGKNGRYINADELTYNIYSLGDDEPMAEGLSEREFFFSGLPTEGEQFATGLYVTAQNQMGESDKTLGIVFAGEAYQLPFHETFADGNPIYSTWTATTANSFQIFPNMSYDDEGGCIAFLPNFQGDNGIISSGKISLANAQQPKLSFYYWAVPHSDVEIKVLVARNSLGNASVVKTFDLRGEDQGWQKAMVDLTPFKTDEGYITVQFYGMSTNPSVPPIVDNIVIDDVADNDLAIVLNAPTRTNVGADAEFDVKVSNMGNNAATDAFVRLKIDGNVVDEQTINVAVGEDLRTKMHFKVDASLEEQYTAVAEVEWAADQNTDNNTSEAKSVKVIHQDIPTVSYLAATINNDNKAQLSWTAPATDTYQYEENFETYDAFSISNMGYWTLYDGDKAETSAVGGAYYDNMFEPCAFMVFNPEESGLNLENLPQFAAHSGDQYITTFTNGTIGNDDWIISPELSGEAQTISFFCKSISAENGLETFEVLASSEGTDIESFAVVSEETEAQADDWAEVSVSLPAGTKHFAIRCTSVGQFMFMVDDVKYIGKPVEIIAYNIYRDGTLVATVSNTATADSPTMIYVDPEELTGNTHVYNVTIVTASSEGDFSNAATIDPTGIAAPITDNTNDKRYTADGRQASSSHRGLQIVTRKGKASKKVLKK